MEKVWITSDLHLCHDRPFCYEPRGFSTVSEMNKAIVKNWNETVGPNDRVYVLGDLMLCNNKEGASLIKTLKGKLYIILGNHDTDVRAKMYEDLDNVETVGFGSRVRYKKWSFLLTHYPTLCANLDDGKSVSRHTINLCGHSHTLDKWADWDKGCIYHCELDAHNMFPVALDEIIDDLRTRPE